MLSKEKYLLEIITNLCIYCDYEVERVSHYLDRSIYDRYLVFITNVCNLGSNFKVIFNERK